MSALLRLRRPRLTTNFIRVFSSNAPAPPPPDPDPQVVEAIVQKVRLARRAKALPEHIRMLPDLPGDEPENRAEVAILSGQPEEQRERVVQISQNAKSHMTSFKTDTHKWHIRWQWKALETNPLMGWESSDDPMASMNMEFEDKNKAMLFCEKMGWKYEVLEPEEYTHEALYGEKSYSFNFLPEDVLEDLRVNKTKTKHFDMPGQNQSHYFRPLNYHGTSRVEQHGPLPTK